MTRDIANGDAAYLVTFICYAELAAKTVVFEELKDGKPDPGGYREYQDGNADLGKSAEEPE